MCFSFKLLLDVNSELKAKHNIHMLCPFLASEQFCWRDGLCRPAVIWGDRHLQNHCLLHVHIYLFIYYSDLLRTGRSDDRGWSPGGGWEFFSSTPCPDQLWGPPSLISTGYRGCFPGVKRLGREADHSLHLLPRRMRGAVPPLPNTSSWRAS